jgi:hypothetical protein
LSVHSIQILYVTKNGPGNNLTLKACGTELGEEDQSAAVPMLQGAEDAGKVLAPQSCST